MSAYKQFTDIKFCDPSILIATLKALGYKAETGRSLALHGYHGDIRSERAQIVVRRQQIGESSNDLGFVWDGKAFTPIISEFDARHVLTEDWRQQLQRTYAKIAVLRFLEAKGANIQQVAVGGQGMVIRATVEVTS